MITLTLCAVVAALSGLPTAVAKIDPSKFGPSDTIRRDVAVIGGGASGAHAAARLHRDFGKSVIVVEKQPLLGGHVDTHIEADTGAIHDYGVQVFFPYEDALDFIAGFNISLVPRTSPAGTGTPRYVDFTTGKELQGFVLPSSDAGNAAVRKYHDLLVQKGYDKMTQPGYWNLPAGPDIPDDLLLPIGEFVKKYDIEPLLALMYPSTGGGVGSRGNFSNIMTLTIMKAFPAAWVKVFFGEIAMSRIATGNQELYDKIAKLLGDENILYNSIVADSERGADGVKLVVQTEHGEKLIVAKKLLLAIPPTRENLKPFDLNEYETVLFAKPKYGRSHTGIASHSKLPNNTILRNMPPSAVQNPLAPFLDTPFVLSFSSYGPNSSLFSLGASSSDYNAFDEKAAQKLAQETVQRMADAGTLPNLEGEPVKFDAWSDHGVGGYGVSAADLRNGWMSDFYSLQGARSTWFTGGAIAVDFTPVLWKFNDGILPKIVKDL